MSTEFPGFTGEGHPEIFDIRAMPAQPEVLKPGQLERSLIEEYFTKVSYFPLSHKITYKAILCTLTYFFMFYIYYVSFSTRIRFTLINKPVAVENV